MRGRGRARRKLHSGDALRALRLRAALNDAATLSVILTILNSSVPLAASMQEDASMIAGITLTAPGSRSLAAALSDGALMNAAATINAPATRSLLASLSDQSTLAAILSHTAPGSAGLAASLTDQALMAAAATITGVSSRNLAAAMADGASTVAVLTHDGGNNSNTVLLLHFDGTNNSTTITDDGLGHTTAHNGTVAGAAKLTTTSPKFGTACLTVGAGSDAVTFTSHADFAFGTGDWCIDFRMKFTAISGTQVAIDFRPAGSNGNYPLIYVGSGTLNFFLNAASRIAGGSFSTGTWYHVEVGRVSGVTRMFVDGTQVGSNYTDTATYLQPGTGRPIIGLSTDGGASGFNGQLDEMRIQKGRGGHTANFTPPAAAYS